MLAIIVHSTKFHTQISGKYYTSDSTFVLAAAITKHPRQLKSESHLIECYHAYFVSDYNQEKLCMLMWNATDPFINARW